MSGLRAAGGVAKKSGKKLAKGFSGKLLSQWVLFLVFFAPWGYCIIGYEWYRPLKMGHGVIC